MSKLQNNQIEKGHITDLDYQMNTIEQILLAQKDRILTSEIPIKESTEVIYEAIDKQMDVLISKTDYPCKHLFQIGAVFINGDREVGSFCSYKRFEYINLETNERTNLMSNFS